MQKFQYLLFLLKRSYYITYMTVPLSLELLSPEIVSVSENKELLRHFRVYRVRTTSAQTDG